MNDPRSVAPLGSSPPPSPPITAVARWVVLLLALAVAAIGLLMPAGPEAQDQVLELAATDYVKSDSPLPPTGAVWQPRTLPDDWSRSNPGQDGHGWYRATFTLASRPAQPWAVYLPRVGTNYTLYLNGALVGGGTRSSLGVPQMDVLAAPLLLPGRNELHLRLHVAPNLRGGLGPITLGPRAVVQPIYERDYFARVTLTRSLNLALIFVGLLVLLLWLRRPGERIHGLFAALAITWSLRNFHYTVSPLFAAQLWEAFILGSLGMVVVLLWLFIRSFTLAPRRPFERWAALAVAVAAIGIALLDGAPARVIRIPWYLACAALGAWTIVLLLRFGLKPGNRTRSGVWVIVAAEVVTLGLGLLDLSVTAQVLPFGPAARMAYGAPLILCALVYALADDYFRTYDEVRVLNANLERRVAERTVELERTHERLRALERATTLTAERARVMRDMHDGVGSQLVTTLIAVERGKAGTQEVASMLRECMDDLRLVIDSLDPDEDSLAVALRNLRHRIEPRFLAAGILLDWEVQDGVRMSSPGQVLQVLRIVQEALTNALRHASARRLRLFCGNDGGGLLLQLEDDGVGCASQADAGRGRRNMAARAHQLGGTLALREGPTGGALVELCVPAAPESAPAA
ncbi:sensor histidine kinase [Ramlibacter algicola]|uniref:histidine kinase n=1 Tax=Ramlibacter algicola TaxID=2795217 RepID=A0A934PY65_9BURK|nr:histidine kinase [Ramlibacter algicola]MBK0391293.1 hypothetical protein [Ramlibacter algicola]